jgi:hypothetical protein
MGGGRQKNQERPAGIYVQEKAEQIERLQSDLAAALTSEKAHLQATRPKSAWLDRVREIGEVAGDFTAGSLVGIPGLGGMQNFLRQLVRQLASRAITRSRDVIVLLVEFHDRIDTPSPLRSAIGHAILAAAGMLPQFPM